MPSNSAANETDSVTDVVTASASSFVTKIIFYDFSELVSAFTESIITVI